jgi:membrane protease YdiL (CAAX protease family)
MSTNDPLPEQPAERPADGPPPFGEAITPPPADYQPPPARDGERTPRPPGWQPELVLPERSLRGEPRRPHPNFWWSCLWCLLFLLATQIPGAVVAAVIAVALAMIAPDRYSIGDITNQADILKSPAMSVGLAVGIFIIELSVVGLSLMVIRIVVGRDWPRQLAVRRPSVAHTLLALASLPALILLGNVAYEVLRSFFHVPSLSDYGFGGMEEMVDVASKWPYGFAVLVIGLGPGIGEELWCRGFLGRGLVGNYGAVLGVVLSSFFFGLIHVDPCQGTMAMLMGLWLHFVYLTTRSLWLPMMLHFLNNSLAVVAPRFPQLAWVDTKPTDIPALVYVTATVLLAAVAYALYQGRARLAARSPEQIVLWRPEYPGVAYPPPDSGTNVLRPSPPPLALALCVGAALLFVAACVAWVRSV